MVPVVADPSLVISGGDLFFCESLALPPVESVLAEELMRR